MWGWTCFAQGAGTDLDSVTGSATGRRERPLRNGTKTRTQRSRSHRTLCPLLWLFYLGASENTFLLEWAKILPQTGWRSFLLLVRRPSLSSSLLRCVFFFFLICIFCHHRVTEEITIFLSSFFICPRVAFAVSFEVPASDPNSTSAPEPATTSWMQRGWKYGESFSYGGVFFFFLFFFAEHRLHDVSDMLFDLAEAQSVWFFPSKERSKNLFTPAFNLSKSIF